MSALRGAYLIDKHAGFMISGASRKARAGRAEVCQEMEASMSSAENGKPRTSAPARSRPDFSRLERMSDALRLMVLLQARDARAQDLRPALAAAPVLTLLMEQFVACDAQAPQWPDRDRLVFSAASLKPLATALYALLGQRLVPNAQNDGEDAGESGGEDPCKAPRRGLDLPFEHPGHGLAAAVGMAMATRLLAEEFGADVMDHATWVLADNADIEPGLAQEAIALAPGLRPHRLTVLHFAPKVAPDAQAISCPGHLARFAAAGWHVQRVDAADLQAVAEALEKAGTQDTELAEERRPAYVAIEYEVDEDLATVEELRQRLGLPEDAGAPAGESCDAWRLLGLKGSKKRRDWEKRLKKLSGAEQAAFQHRMAADAWEDFRNHMRAWRLELAGQEEPRNPWRLFGELWKRSGEDLPGLMAGCALARPWEPGEDEQNDSLCAQLRVGLRPGALVALMAGMAAHGGFTPCAHIEAADVPQVLTLLEEAAHAGLSLTVVVRDDGQCALDRLSAIMAKHVDVLRPADVVELVECWQIAMQMPQRPCVLMVPDMKLPVLRATPEKTNFARLGAYELFAAEETIHATIVGAGWMLGSAVQAARALAEEGIYLRVISAPAIAHLGETEPEHQSRLAHQQGLRIALSALPFGLGALMCGDQALNLDPCAGVGKAQGDVQELRRRIEELLREWFVTTGEEAGDGEAPA